MAPYGYMDTNLQGTKRAGWWDRLFGSQVALDATGPTDPSHMSLAQYMAWRDGTRPAMGGPTDAPPADAPAPPAPAKPPTAAETPLIIGRHFFAEYRQLPTDATLFEDDQPWAIYSLRDAMQAEDEAIQLFYVSSEANARQLIEALDRTFEAGRTPEQTWTTINRSAGAGEVVPDGAIA